MSTDPASPDPLGLDASLGRARMVLAMLAAPKLRAGLAAILVGDGADQPPDVQGPLSRLDWLEATGEVDLVRLRAAIDAIALLRSPAAILEVPALDVLPAREHDRVEVSCRIARLVFERVGPGRTLSEPELNAAIAVFTSDVALVRRDAVDAGVLTRTPDGAAYHAAEGVTVPSGGPLRSGNPERARTAARGAATARPGSPSIGPHP